MAQFGKIILTAPNPPVQEFLLSKPLVSLGRANTNDIVLQDPRTSRSHAQIECSLQGCTLLDLESSNGTLVNGERVQKAPLVPGDQIQIGALTLRFEAPSALEEEAMARIESEGDLERTLSEMTVPVALNDTTRPHLVVHTPDRTWEIPLEDGLTIGRQAGNSLVLDQAKVSRQHARIERRAGGWILRDLNSTNGTWVGGRRIEEHRLQSGEAIRIGMAQLVFKDSFVPEQLTLMDGTSFSASEARRPVVFVPGIMGSSLYQGSEQVWPNVRYLFRHPEIFHYSEDSPLEPRGLVNEVVIVPNLIKLEQYSRLGDYLVEELGYTREKDFLEFAYDWRQDVRRSAVRLAQAIDAWQAAPPLTIIAHSLGTLVSRYYIERLGGKKKVDRLLLLGGPHQGVPKIAANLLSGLKLLPFGLMSERLGQVISTFPSCYQILPIYSCAFDQNGHRIDFLQDESWVSDPFRPLLGAAREFRQELGDRSSVPAVSIFGYGLKTIANLRVIREPGGWQNITYDVSPSGDSSVPESSAVLPGSEIHPVQQYHGTLYIDNDVKMRLKLELTKK